MLLEALATRLEGTRLSDLAREAGLAPSTTHRLLTTLERNGFAQFDPLRSKWHVGRKAFAVGVAFTNLQSFIAAALPLMRRLRDATKETANLGILEDGEVITVAQVGSRVAGRVQTGYVYTYAFVMLIGLTAAVTWVIAG